MSKLIMLLSLNSIWSIGEFRLFFKIIINNLLYFGNWEIIKAMWERMYACHSTLIQLEIFTFLEVQLKNLSCVDEGLQQEQAWLQMMCYTTKPFSHLKTVSMQVNINRVIQWSRQNTLTLNGTKCKSMMISRKKISSKPSKPLWEVNYLL